MGCADTADADGRRGSNVYEDNPWLWQFGRGKLRLGDLTVEETALKKAARHKEQAKRAVEIRWKRIERDSNEVCFHTSTYQYIPIRTSMYCVLLNFALLEILIHHIVSLA
jgi:hypothetical protein